MDQIINSTKIIHTQNETLHIINGPAGQLEVAMSQAVGAEKSIWGIVCHPHPMFGGNMQNKVVTTLVKTFQALGVTTVRFNFRGVGQSAGQYDDGEGEVQDLLAVVDWMQRTQSKNEIWLAGFSFGAYIAAKGATILPINQLVTVAPPIKTFHMERIPPITCPWIVVQGEKDDVTPALDFDEWIADREPKPTIIRFPTAGHYFHGQLSELRSAIVAKLESN